ncbi:reverse transcriptase family protein [bacterium]|nr:reverse transcriptase family protein [bacterium]
MMPALQIGAVAIIGLLVAVFAIVVVLIIVVNIVNQARRGGPGGARLELGTDGLRVSVGGRSRGKILGSRAPIVLGNSPTSSYRERDDKMRQLHPQSIDRQRSLRLPVLEKPDDIVAFLQLRDFRELVHLCDTGRMQGLRNGPGKLRNYTMRTIPKRGGGQRFLFIPKPRLKAAQRRILHEILDKVPVHEAAKGFVRGRDATDHARPHIGKPIIVAHDIADFFPSIRYRRVCSFFMWLGYPHSVARILSLLCTTASLASLARVLPQGAPTSPALANALCYRLDCRLAGLAKKFGATYTRYADDLAFSGGEDFKRGLNRFVPLVETILKSERFHPKKAKRRFMRRGRQQNLVGLNVNDRLSVGRAEIDRLCAILHNASKAGSLESQNRDRIQNFADHLGGRIAWVERFHPGKGAKLRSQWRQLIGAPPAPPPPDLPAAPPPE